MPDKPHVSERRNQWLSTFFNTIFPNKIRVMGKDQAPFIVYDNKLCLSCYVKNFYLHLTDKPFDASVLYTTELKEVPEYNAEDILQWFSNAVHRPVYKVYLQKSDPRLYLAGFTYKDPVKKTGKAPVFAIENPNIYFKKDNAQDVAEGLCKEGYNVLSC